MEKHLSNNQYQSKLVTLKVVCDLCGKKDHLHVHCMNEDNFSYNVICLDCFQKIETDPLIQYFIVNNELSMSKGKVAAQVSHASTVLAVRDGFTKNFNEWLNNIKRVIVLQADEEEMLYIHDNVPKSIKIVDKGFTEIPENSFTVLGLPIMRKSEAKEHVGHLKLLK